MKNNYTTYRNFQIQQPFFSFNVMGYSEKMTAKPYHALFYEFSTSKVIDRNQNDDLFMTCIPDGCIDIVFIQNNQTFKMEFIGSPFSHKPLIVYPGASYFGVRMMPGMFFPYSTICIRDITNTETFVPHISPYLEKLMESVFAAVSLDEKIDLFFSHLLQYTPDEFTVNETLQSVLYLISMSKGTLEVSDIAQKVCYSERHLTRMFSDTMGYSPKMFCRISRFQYALSIMMERKSDAVSSFITMLNYSDQAHFQREFKEFTGLTPRHFIQDYADTILREVCPCGERGGS